MDLEHVLLCLAHDREFQLLPRSPIESRNIIESIAIYPILSFDFMPKIACLPLS